MRIPFDIKYRPQIESGEYKVVTDIGEPVEIVKWDCKGMCPILAVIDCDDVSYPRLYLENGSNYNNEYPLLYVLIEE